MFVRSRRYALSALILGTLGACGQKDDDKGTTQVENQICPAAQLSQCETLIDEISEARRQQAVALEENNLQEAFRYTLVIDYKTELLELNQSATVDDAAMQRAQSRFNMMMDLLGGGEAMFLSVANPAQCGEFTAKCQSLIEEIKHLSSQREKALEQQNAAQILQLDVEIAYRRQMVQVYQENDQNKMKLLIESYNTLSGLIAGGGGPTLGCSGKAQARCQEIESEIASMKIKRDQAMTDLDHRQANQISFRINYLTELAGLLAAGHAEDSKTVQELTKKYEVLNFLAVNDLPAYSQEELVSVKKVFDEFGDLYISETGFSEGGHPNWVEIASSRALPWAGYWFPSRSDMLFAGENSPLAKFDALAKIRGLAINSVGEEVRKFNPGSAEWAGLCDAWGMASIQTKEPSEAVTIEGITFTISDQKALITKFFENSKKRVYGNVYKGGQESDGTYQDLRPEAFHRLIEMAIGKNGQQVVMDDDPGYELWSRPMFKMRYAVSPDPENPDAYLVNAKPQTIKNRNGTSEVLTKLGFQGDDETLIYTYRLYVDRTYEKDGKYKVIYGEWIGDSARNHPDMIFLAPENGPLLDPYNKELAKAMDLFKVEFLDRGAP